MNMSWGAYFNVPYSYPPWFHNLYMPPLPTYLCPNYITYREPAINESSPTNNDHFNYRNRSMQKSKRKVIKQVYRVKKDGRLNKTSDLTLDIEKSNIEELSASSIDQIAPDVEHISNDMAEQESSSAGGKGKKKKADSKSTGLTGSRNGLTGTQTGLTDVSSGSENSSTAINKTRPSFKELLVKYKNEGDTQAKLRMRSHYQDLASN